MRIRRLVRWTGSLVGVVMLLFVAAGGVLYASFTRRMATQWAMAWLTEQTGMRTEIEQIGLRFPLRIEAKGVHIGELLSIAHISTDIRLRPLLQGVMRSNYIQAKGIHIYPDTLSDILVHELRVDSLIYNWREQKAHIHHIALDGGDIVLHASTAPRTRKSKPFRLPLTCTISHITTRNVRASYTDTQMHLRASASGMSMHHIVADTAMHISLASTHIEEGALTIQRPHQEDWGVAQLTLLTDSLHYSPKRFAGHLREASFYTSHDLTLQEGTLRLTWDEGVLSIPQLQLRTPYSTLSGQLYTSGNDTKDMAVKGYADLRLGYADALCLAKWIDDSPSDFADLYPRQQLSATIALEGTMEQLRLSQCHVALPTCFDLRAEGSMLGLSTPSQSHAQCRFEVKTYETDLLTALTKNSSLSLLSDMLYQGAIHYAPDTLHLLCDITLTEGRASVEASYRPTSGRYILDAHTHALNLRHILPGSTLGKVSMHAHLTGNSFHYNTPDADISGTLQLDTLQWRDYTLTHASARASLTEGQLHAYAACDDSLMRWHLTGTARHAHETVEADLKVHIATLNLQALALADTDIRPALQCRATLSIDSGEVYTLQAHFTDLALATPTQQIRPRPITLQATLTPDTALLGIRSGDLILMAHAQHRRTHPNLSATLSAGSDNPVSNYLALLGIKSESLSAKAHYTDGTLRAHLQSGTLAYHTPLMTMQGEASASLTWGGDFAPDSLSGVLHLTEVRYSLPSYNLSLHTEDTLSVPFERGEFILTALPLYTTEKQPLLLDGRVRLFGTAPVAHLHLTANKTNLIQSQATREAQLYGQALVSGSITLDGTFDALSLAGELRLLPNSSIHYIYRDAILTSGNQLDKVVTFVSFAAEGPTPAPPKRCIATGGIDMSLNLLIDPTAQLEVSLGANQQNSVALQGGGALTLQYTSATGLRLSGRYTIETGNLTMNVPLLHVSNMTLRQGSAITWSGNPLNPMLNISAEERIRASVTLDGSPQVTLFVAGVSISETLEKPDIQLTLSAPENASMQNTLATLSPEERGKLAVALLTTGLYLGEGGTGNIMNTALMSILQSQFDNISRDAFRTVDVSVGIEPLPDGVSGVSTRTDYSFSIAKRLWDNRIRITIGGSVTTTNERIADNAVIDNISIEWRISPIGNQYLRFFYDKNYESILEGEIRETGVGYAYRRRF